MGDVHVQRYLEGWAVIEEGKDTLQLFLSKGEAAEWAERKAHRYHTNLIIDELDGNVVMANT